MAKSESMIWCSLGQIATMFHPSHGQVHRSSSDTVYEGDRYRTSAASTSASAHLGDQIWQKVLTDLLCFHEELPYLVASSPVIVTRIFHANL
jgi:hypothetical protein